MEDEELDANTKLKKAKKLVKMKNEMMMAYVTQCLSSTAMLNAIFNVQAEVGWLTGKACQLFDNLKQKYNPNDKLSRAQMIKKLNKTKSKKEEDPKVICNKIESLKIKYLDQAKILDNKTIVTHLFLVCAKLYKSELTQAQVEEEVNDMEIMYESLIRCMNVVWRIKSSGEGVAQVGESEVMLRNTEFKGKCHTCGKVWASAKQMS